MACGWGADNARQRVGTVPAVPLSKGRPPVIVIDATASSDHGDGPLDGVVLPGGWSRREGFGLPARPWDLASRRWICVGRISGDEEASAALAALVRGVGLAVAVDGGGRFRLRVLDDLHRAGEVTIAGNDTRSLPTVDADAEILLESLAAGATVEEAAQAAHLSARTAHRRLAAVRDAYGAANTTEALACWLADRGSD